MHIVHLAPELAPIAKVGGLADVVFGLCRELCRQGHRTEIILPLYASMDRSPLKGMEIEHRDFKVPYSYGEVSNTIWRAELNELTIFFIDPHNIHPYFRREAQYGSVDDAERFTYFSHAALHFLYRTGRKPDAIHLHDWQTAIAAPLIKEFWGREGEQSPTVVYTIHNIDYQGLCGPEILSHVGMAPQQYLTTDKFLDLYYPHTVNLMKGGIVYADWVTTVSPRYAREIQTPEGGRGLDGMLRRHHDKLQGVLNGLDFDYWNPLTDPFLTILPNVKKRMNRELRKAAYRTALRQTLKLEQRRCPIVICISRLVPQKGIELIEHALFQTIRQDGQFVLLGSSPIPEIEKKFHQLQVRFGESSQARILLQHREDLAHMIFAAGDIIIVPSLFEPCGLTQLIGLRYGAIPVVRETGGLADTVFDIDHSDKPLEARNGFSFKDANPQGLDSALNRAFHYWGEKPDIWNQLTTSGMKLDNSWKKSCKEYLKLYKAERRSPCLT